MDQDCPDWDGAVKRYRALTERNTADLNDEAILRELHTGFTELLVRRLSDTCYQRMINGPGQTLCSTGRWDAMAKFTQYFWRISTIHVYTARHYKQEVGAIGEASQGCVVAINLPIL